MAKGVKANVSQTLDRWSHLQNPVYKTALATLVEKVKDGGICFSKVQSVREVGNCARIACEHVAQSQQPDSSVQERVESWPPLPNATVRPPTMKPAKQ